MLAGGDLHTMKTRNRFPCLVCGLAVGILAAAAAAQDTPIDAKPAPAPDAIAVAHHKATVDNQRVLLHFPGGDAQVEAGLAAVLKQQRRLLSYEYQTAVVEGDGVRATALARRFEITDGRRPALVVLDAGGGHIHTISRAEMTADGAFDANAVTTALQTHVAPALNARDVLAQGLAEAKNSQRNAFIYLSAPW